jgi:hypothetical protein
MPFDFKSLANSLVNNGQRDLPPSDTLRMATVIGFDPGYGGTATGYNQSAYAGPTLSIQLAGDVAPIHGVSYSNGYTPKLNDTVFVMMSDSDIIVTMSVRGNTPATNGSGTAGNGGQGGNHHLHAHKKFTYTQSFTGNPNSPTNIGSATTTGAPFLTTDVYPDTLYEIKATATFQVTATDANGYVSLGVITPDGYHEIQRQQTTQANSYYTLSGHTTWSKTHTGNLAPGVWTNLFPNSAYTWLLAVQYGSATTGGTTALTLVPSITLTTIRGSYTTQTPQTMYVTDMGKAT